jgi:hypothetical protein
MPEKKGDDKPQAKDNKPVSPFDTWAGRGVFQAGGAALASLWAAPYFWGVTQLATRTGDSVMSVAKYAMKHPGELWRASPVLAPRLALSATRAMAAAEYLEWRKAELEKEGSFEGFSTKDRVIATAVGVAAETSTSGVLEAIEQRLYLGLSFRAVDPKVLLAITARNAPTAIPVVAGVTAAIAGSQGKGGRECESPWLMMARAGGWGGLAGAATTILHSAVPRLSAGHTLEQVVRSAVADVATREGMMNLIVRSGLRGTGVASVGALTVGATYLHRKVVEDAAREQGGRC